MGGVLRYKLEVYCQYFSDKLHGLGVPEQCPMYSEVSKRDWREGVGDQLNCVLLLIRGHRKRGQKKGLNLWYGRDFLAPTPSVRKPLFETSDVSGKARGTVNRVL